MTSAVGLRVSLLEGQRSIFIHLVNVEAIESVLSRYAAELARV